METPGLKDYLVISEALWGRLRDPGALADELARFGAPIADPGLIEAVRRAIRINGIDRFSYQQARERGELRGGTEEVCQALLEIGEPLADVLADEWAFVTSQSLAALAERTGHALGAFARAGATVVGVVKERMVEALEGVREKIPPDLLEQMKRVDETWDRVPKFLLAGGALAAELSVALAPVGIAVHIAEVLLEGNAVLAGDP